ncbi:anthranilate synthase component I family protein [Desulfovibrio mangrovi]|uniref:chorismate-binding protein n=1 Tax=Desulfovibrio mangrovi TaxID=2976983 RepID=UPI002245CD16|nr:chorismate-binding protein [Desulfovibrio mangrovi]UZP66441.1 anthranilate synthase component I family protein [Desulfovibrio mangrovi]
MPCVFSATISNSALPALLHRLACDYGADLLLCGNLGASAAPQADRCIIGIGPARELEVTESTSRAELQAFCFKRQADALPGTFGYLSYTYGLSLYGIASEKPAELPLGLFRRYAVQLILTPQRPLKGFSADTEEAPQEDTITAYTLLCHAADTPPESVNGMPCATLLRSLEALCTDEASPIPAYAPPLSPAELNRRLRQSLSEKAYIEGVERVLEHIRDGDTYQLNLSTRFDVDLSATDFDPLTFFLHMWQQHPAPFYAWLRHGNKRIISTSPERFLCVRDGEVLSQPIKGTLAFETYAAGMEKALVHSAKESAELSMIVDLIRNDIATRCEYGSVQVPAHKATFIVDRLIQMYSDVRGRLRKDSTCLDLLLDAFPGGSITGCPKRRTMRIIEKEEPHCRDLYCGSIVFIEDERNMDSSIAIRTGWYDTESKALCFFAGSGIVLDSNPANEYHETLAKAGKFLRALAS